MNGCPPNILVHKIRRNGVKYSEGYIFSNHFVLINYTYCIECNDFHHDQIRYQKNKLALEFSNFFFFMARMLVVILININFKHCHESFCIPNTRLAYFFFESLVE